MEQLTLRAFKPIRYKPPKSVEPSFLTDRHSMSDLIEHTARIVKDKHKDLEIGWMGAPTNNIEDDTDDVIPEDAILRDIAFQTYAIERGLERPKSNGDPTLAFYDDIRALNGDRFEDYGALLLEHDHDQNVGVSLARLMVKGGNVCFEFGVCKKTLPDKYMNRTVEDPVRMSHGFITLENESGYVSVHTYERSALVDKRPANPITFFLATRSQLTTDRGLGAILDKIEAAKKSR